MKAPTRHPDVNDTAAALLAVAIAALGEGLVGYYLYGSLAWGGFDPATSDIDFVAVTREALTPGEFDTLATAHAALASSGSRWSRDIEGYYLPLAQVRRYDPASPPVARIERGADASFLYWTHQHWDGVIQRHQLRERGIVLHGPHPRDLIDPVSDGDLRRAAAAHVPEIRAWLEQEPDALRHDGLHGYVVLTQCRILYTLALGEVASKPDAAAWAATNLPEPLAALARKAARAAVGWEDRATTASLVELTLTLAGALDG